MDSSEVQVTSVEELSMFLASTGIDVSSYGTSPYKSMSELYQEIVNNETKLLRKEQGVVRSIAVATARIRNPIDKNKVLYEAKQEWPAISRVRCRNILPAGKMIHGTAYEDNIAREIREELGTALTPSSKIEVDLNSIEVKKTCETSRSYPGLITEYTTYKADVNVTEIPSENFITQEETELSGVLISHWEWRNEE